MNDTDRSYSTDGSEDGRAVGGRKVVAVPAQNAYSGLPPLPTSDGLRAPAGA